MFALRNVLYRFYHIEPEKNNELLEFFNYLIFICKDVQLDPPEPEPLQYYIEFNDNEQKLVVNAFYEDFFTG